MNYLKQLRAFYDALELNPLNASEVALWHALTWVNNKTGWKYEFTVASSVLCQKAGLKSDNFYKVRNKLQQAGYINWRPRRGNQAAVYQMVKLYDLSVNNTGSHTDTFTGNRTDTFTGNRTALTKLNETKQDDVDDDARVKKLQAVFELWQHIWDFPNAVAQQDLQDWFKEIGPELLTYAITEAGRSNVPARNADRYIQRTIDHMQEQKITTVQQAKEAAEKHRQQIHREISQTDKSAYTKNKPVTSTGSSSFDASDLPF
ncbi:DnaD domain protein [Lentilactobacillus hilgardii]|uniref:DnaD domain protein n=1 Tax=Lentilactobacillus hilgardii TaxID=1588 RepID=UPI0021C2B524|nr:DnaD domain protein [Lentilactobacillus hilgardii]MCP9331900.1 DnaD domain protein [Lentilactobacillus hilgardii]MCP9348467.1 DnaD domain protein [Lentilactobacillus hilgardii]MCP9351315.1 DnaD domain protein [Lentilactobacillus hilgardii]